MDEFQFIIDSREKRPYRIEGAIVKKLDTGDYSLVGCEKIMAIERKSFDDLYNCLSSKLGRFKKQLKRMQSYKYKALLIDSTVSSVLLGHVMCKLPGGMALERLLRLAGNVPVLFVDSHGKEVTQTLLGIWWKEEEQNEQKSSG